MRICSGQEVLIIVEARAEMCKEEVVGLYVALSVRYCRDVDPGVVQVWKRMPQKEVEMQTRDATGIPNGKSLARMSAGDLPTRLAPWGISTRPQPTPDLLSCSSIQKRKLLNTAITEAFASRSIPQLQEENNNGKSNY